MSILQELDHLRIPFKDIKHATNNFAPENLIRPGGSARAYKGELLRPQGLTTVAVKLVDRRFNRSEKQFLNEITILSSYKHINIISLIGFCDECDEKILALDFMTYGSLSEYLSNANLTWLKRLQICLGAAHGLSYLHNGLGGESTVIHRLITSKTILLDKNWQAKISGFGHSIIGPIMNHSVFVKDSFIEPGFADPTYLQTGVVTKESDVYSFGVVLFEVLCGRQAVDQRGAGNNKIHFLGPLAQLHYREGRLNQIIDPILREQMNLDSLKEFSAIAYQCLEKNRTARPTMNEIVQRLDNVLRLQQSFEKALALQKVIVIRIEFKHTVSDAISENIEEIDRSHSISDTH